MSPSYFTIEPKDVKSAPAASHSQPAVIFSYNKSAPSINHSQPNRVMTEDLEMQKLNS